MRNAAPNTLPSCARRAFVLAASILTWLAAAPVGAQVTASLEVQRVDEPTRVALSLVGDGSSVDVVLDRRLLSFTLRAEGRRRPLRCRHPAAPARVSRARVVHLDAEHARVGEWIDLRMYCSGDALRALLAGATVEARYGFSRRGRGRWVARPEGGRPLSRLEIGPLVVPPTTAPPASEAALDVELRTHRARAGEAPRFEVRLRPREGAPWLYPRADLLRFHLAGPLGEVDCAPRRTAVNPIIDFYRRASRRHPVTLRIDLGRACPDAFTVPGVYEVTPTVDLVYGAAGHDLEVLTGTFTGRPSVVRVVGRRYVEHPLEDTP